MNVRRTTMLLLLCLTFVAQMATAASFTSGNIVVYRVGDGSAALGSSATAVFLDEYTPLGTLVQSIAMPTAVSGSNHRLTASGNSTTEGFMTLSVNGQYLVLAGYDADLGTATIAGTASATTGRVIGRVDGNGTIDTTTTITDAFSGGNPRSVASTDGSSFWTVGSVSGVRMSALGATLSTSISTTNTNLRDVGIFAGQLYFSSGAGSVRMAAVGSGIPTTGPQTATNLPGLPTATNSLNGFVFADLSAAVPGVDTLYIADDGTNALLKYSLVSGSWVSNGTVAVTAARGLSGSVSGTTVTLFGTSGTAGTTLYKYVDSAGYNAAPNGTVATVVSAGANKAFRGVAFAPSGTVVQPTNPTGTGAATPNSVLAGNSTLLTVTVTPGANPTSSALAVSANLSAIGGSSTQAFFDDGTNGDATAGDKVFSYSATVNAATAPGGKSLAFSITDGQARSGSGNISVTVTASSTPISATASAAPSSVVAGSQTLLTATVTPGTNPASSGILVTGNLTAINGSSSQQFYNDGTNGDAVANDNIYSYLASVPVFATSGSKSIAVSVVDAQARSASANITVNVIQPASHVTISQLYGGGGNSGATYNHDYVELYNPTAAAVDLTGWSVQYASASGTSWQTQILGGTIGAGEYYLISLGTNNAGVGAALPAANVVGSINMSGTTGKVALSNSPEPLADGCPAGGATVVDFIGYGTADCREGATNAPAPSNSTADLRRNGGAVDTDVNGSDFSTGTPNPRRTAAIVEFGPIVVSVDPRANNGIAPRDASITVNFSEAVNLDAGWFSITCSVSGTHNDATTANTADKLTWVATPNVSFTPGEQCTVTVLRDHVHDVDTDDAGVNDDNLPADKTWSFTVATGAPAPYSPDVHLTMGNPSGAVADVLVPTNYLMMKPTYALSYNRDKGTPNWVSWHLDSSWYGSLARIDTFRPDPQVPADWYRVQGFDFSSTGFDRGHMTPNADRDHQDRIPINQETYLMSNMVPQSPDNNQGPWANLESYLRQQTDAGSEIYIVSGPAGVGGTGSNGFMTSVAGGHVVVPAQTWKVALFLPKADGDDVARVTASTRTLAVLMPNVQGIRSVDWTTYITTVDAIESLTGYNFFSNVPQAIQNAIEAGTNGSNPPGAGNQSVSTHEDDARTFTLDAASPNANPLTYTIVSGPSHGTLSAGSNGSETYTPAPDFNGTDTFTWNVSDGSHTSNTATATVSVLEVNDAPAAVRDSKSTDEDTPLTFPAADLAANDSAGPANESSQTLTVSAVSATASTHGTVTLGGGNVTYTPAPNYNGPASFTYQVCDNGFTAGLADSQCTTGTVDVTVNAVNDAPSAVNDAATTDEDTPVTIDVLANDSDVDHDALTITAPGTPSHGSASVVSGKIVYTPNANYNGGDSFTYTVSDGQLTATATVNVTINAVNDPPSAFITAPATGSEGTSISVSGSASDVDDNSFGFAWVVTKNGSPYATGSGTPFSFTPNDNGTYAVTLTVSDSSNATGVASASITVGNVAPSIDSVSGPVAPLALGTAASISIGYSDAGSADTHTATLTWDDGTQSTVACAAGTCSASHTYGAAGVYGAGITVTDDDGGNATSRFEYVVVYDAAAGFVTGSGSINSPAGAYVAKPELTGKATFGFVSKYAKGTTVPSGDTSFQFDVASFSFASTSYDWLVIAGAKAQYKGSGKVNGAGNYGFLLTATDGDLSGGAKGGDKFRIKIWDKSTGLTVYDNVIGGSDDIDAANPQVIAAGQITIHNNTK